MSDYLLCNAFYVFLFYNKFSLLSTVFVNYSAVYVISRQSAIKRKGLAIFSRKPLAVFIVLARLYRLCTALNDSPLEITGLFIFSDFLLSCNFCLSAFQSSNSLFASSVSKYRRIAGNNALAKPSSA